MHLKFASWKLPLSVLLIGLALSMLACSYVRQWEESHNLQEITYRSESRLVAFQGSIEAAMNMVVDIRSAILHELVLEAGDALDDVEFAAIVKSYSSVGDIESLRSVAWVPRSDKRNGRGFSYPVVYSIYHSDFGIHQGVDAATNPTHREHIRMAAVSGKVVADLHLDGDSHQIISLFVPVYHSLEVTPDCLNEACLLGIVYSEWDIGTLLEARSSKLPVSGLDFYLHDISPSGVNTLLFTHPSRTRANSNDGPYLEPVWRELFSVAEHQWQLSAAPAPAFINSHPVVLAWIVILSGIFISLLISIYIWRVSVHSKRIEKEVELRAAEVWRSQQSLMETERIAHLGGWEWIIESDKFSWSDEVFRVFGFEPQSFEPSYEHFLGILHPDDHERVVRAVNQGLEGRPFNIVHRIILPDGGLRAVHEQARVEFDDQNRAVRMVGTVQDITEQRRAERRLHRMAMALSETAESVVITNTEGVIRYVNHAFEKMSGYQADEVLGKKPNMVKSGEHSDEYYAVMWEKISHGEAWFGTFTNKNRKGEKYMVEQTISPIHDMQGDITGYVAVQRDVTGEYERRAKMEHTQRLESLGILAGGIAHDFNNLLTAIMGNAHLAKMRDSNEAAQYLDRIEAASERAAELCRQMLAYSGQGDYLREWFDLNSRICDMAELLQVSLSKNSELSLHLGKFSCRIYGDKSQIQQVVMNLLINASEAIDETGKRGHIDLSTQRVVMTEVDFDHCFYNEVARPKSGAYICLTVKDDGCGMSDEVRLKIFDPFFTTKFTGRGLGTSAMLGIVHAHNGALELETQQDVGTTFKVYFPCEEREESEEAVEQQATAGLVLDLKGKKILLVDDEPYILTVISKMLEESGCEVEGVSSAAQAIERYAQDSQKISLVILDMTMPEMDGLSCAKKLLEINQKAVIVLSSGYSREMLEERIQDTAISGLLQKPAFSNMKCV